LDRYYHFYHHFITTQKGFYELFHAFYFSLFLHHCSYTTRADAREPISALFYYADSILQHDLETLEAAGGIIKLIKTRSIKESTILINDKWR